MSVVRHPVHHPAATATIRMAAWRPGRVGIPHRPLPQPDRVWRGIAAEIVEAAGGASLAGAMPWPGAQRVPPSTR
jgi:hypothetical protein